jgi:uncharacterized protein YjbJ (UPF0337 family)
MTERKQGPEQTAGGGPGNVVGRVKEAIGSAIGNDKLSGEGRAQQVQAQTEREAAELAKEAAAKEERADLSAERVETTARREQLEGELARESREDEIAGAEDAAVAAARERAHEEKMEAEHARRGEESDADARERIARTREVSELDQAGRLRAEAEEAAQKAAAIDPEEKV